MKRLSVDCTALRALALTTPRTALESLNAGLTPNWRRQKRSSRFEHAFLYISSLKVSVGVAMRFGRSCRISISVGKKLIKKDLDLEHQARWTACTGCRQSKTLMRKPLSSRAIELLAMSKLRLRAAVGLLTGHATLRAHLYKLGHTGLGLAS
jgi:hypothetical protein